MVEPDWEVARNNQHSGVAGQHGGPTTKGKIKEGTQHYTREPHISCKDENRQHIKRELLVDGEGTNFVERTAFFLQ